MKRLLVRYIKVWWLMSRNSFSATLSSRLSILVFLLGKVLRFFFFILFLTFLLKGTQTVAGYTSNQIIFFFLTFNLIDIISQFLFREGYRFRRLIVSGDFDLVLVKPISALFRSLMGGADLIDLITIPPLIAATYMVGSGLNPTPLNTLLYILLVVNGIIIAGAFHVLVLSLAIITLEIDHTVMIYRDVVSLGRLPVDIYREPLRSTLTFFVPVGIMISLPAKILMGLLSPTGALMALAIGLFSIFLASKVWDYALMKYASASS